MFATRPERLVVWREVGIDEFVARVATRETAVSQSGSSSATAAVCTQSAQQIDGDDTHVGITGNTHHHSNMRSVVVAAICSHHSSRGTVVVQRITAATAVADYCCV